MKTACAIVNNSRDKALLERAQQIIYNMLFTKDIGNRLFIYINLFGDILSYIEQ